MPVRRIGQQREREPTGHTAPLPFAWGLGIWFGAIGGLAAGLWDVAILGMARAPVSPGADIVVSAMVGAWIGWVGAATGLYGPRWGSASALFAAAWLGSGALAHGFGEGGALPVLGWLLALGLGAVLAQIVGRIDAPAPVHQAFAAAGFVIAAVMGPISTHLLPSAATAGAIGIGLVVIGVAAGFSGLAAVVARDRRAPWVPLVGAVLVGLAANGGVAWRGPSPPLWSDSSTPPVVLVVVSGLRADRTGFQGYEQPRMRASVTPNLDAMAANGVAFLQAHATSNWTVPSLGSMLTGRLPYGHGAGLNDGSRAVDTPLRADVRTLPQAFRSAGLATAAAVADPHLRAYGFGSGFDRYIDDPGHGYLPTILAPLEAAGFEVPAWPVRSDADRVTDAATRLVHELPPTGWFLLVQLDDLAGPVIVSRWDQEPVGRTNRPYPSDEYDAALLRVDRAIGRLLEVVPATARVAVAGDRGLWLGESRPEARSAVLDTPFGGTMFEELLHVPLIFRSPGIRPQRERAAVSVVDLGPTLMRWLGLQVPEGLDGVPLGPVFGAPQEERPIIAQSALVGPEQQAILVGMRKVIQYGDGHTPSYDLGVDPAESSVIAPTATQSAPERRLLAKLPPRGAGATVARPPPMALQMGQITHRLGGAP